MLTVALLAISSLTSAGINWQPYTINYEDRQSVSKTYDDGKYRVIYNAGNRYQWLQGYNPGNPLLDKDDIFTATVDPTAKIVMKSPVTVSVTCHTLLGTSATSAVLPIVQKRYNGILRDVVRNTATNMLTNIEYDEEIREWIPVPIVFTVTAGKVWRTKTITGVDFVMDNEVWQDFDMKLVCAATGPGKGKNVISLDSLAGYYKVNYTYWVQR